MRIAALLALILVLAGCNQVRSGYRPTFTAEELGRYTNFIRFEGEPTIRNGKNLREENDELRRDGWVSIGSTTYSDTLTSAQELRSLAREYKAELVTRYHRETRNFTTMIATSTGPGGALMMIPSTSSVSTYTATFWVRQHKTLLGLYGRNLNQAEALRQGDAYGAVVTLIVRGSIAEQAGFQVGDVITAVDGVEVAGYTDMLNKYFRTHLPSSDFRVTRGDIIFTVAVPKEP